MAYFAACLMIDVICIGLMVYLIRSPFGQYYLLRHIEAKDHPHSQEAVDVSTSNVEMITTSSDPSSEPSPKSSSSSSTATLELPSSFRGKLLLCLDLHKSLWDQALIICANYTFCLLTYPGLSTFVVSYTFNLGDWMPIFMIVSVHILHLLPFSLFSILKKDFDLKKPFGDSCCTAWETVDQSICRRYPCLRVFPTSTPCLHCKPLM